MDLEHVLRVLLALLYITMGGVMFDTAITNLKRDHNIIAGMCFMAIIWYATRLFWMNVGL